MDLQYGYSIMKKFSGARSCEIFAFKNSLKLILKTIKLIIPIYSATCSYNARKLIFQQGGHDS